MKKWLILTTDGQHLTYVNNWPISKSSCNNNWFEGSEDELKGNVIFIGSYIIWFSKYDQTVKNTL